MSYSKNVEQPTAADAGGPEKTSLLNFVVRTETISQSDKHLGTTFTLRGAASTLWKGHYPGWENFCDQVDLAATPTLRAVGYLYQKYDEFEDPERKGTAFLLSPTIGITCGHVAKTINMSSGAVYFAEIDAKLVVPCAKFKEMKKKLDNNDHVFPEIRRVLQLLNSRMPADILEPHPIRQLSSTLTDFCMFSLASPLNRGFLIPSVVGFTHHAYSLPAVVVGIPGGIDDTYITNHKFDRNLINVETCNRLVGATWETWSLCLSFGHVQGWDALQKFEPYAIMHDCYTHPGNSGSPVIPMHDPTKFIAIHFGESRAYLGMNAALPVTNRDFIRSYVKYVLPDLQLVKPELLRGLGQYLAAVKSQIDLADHKLVDNLIQTLPQDSYIVDCCINEKVPELSRPTHDYFNGHKLAPRTGNPFHVQSTIIPPGVADRGNVVDEAEENAPLYANLSDKHKAQVDEFADHSKDPEKLQLATEIFLKQREKRKQKKREKKKNKAEGKEGRESKRAKPTDEMDIS